MWGKFIDLKWELCDILFPPRCGGCDRWGERFCDHCAGSVIIIDGPLCLMCGDRLMTTSLLTCQRCDSNKRNFDMLRSWAQYSGPLKKAIQKLKYKQDIGLANYFAKPLKDLLMSTRWQIDMITAVPLDRDRLLQRGYNQAALLSKSLTRHTGIPFEPDILIKRFPTKPQVGLSEEDRLSNVLNAFSSNPEKIKGKSVLVVDDVITTGATMDACSTALKTSGANVVYGISLARSLRP